MRRGKRGKVKKAKDERKEKEEYLYSAICILCISQSAQAFFIYLNGSQLHIDKAQAAQLIAVYM